MTPKPTHTQPVAFEYVEPCGRVVPNVEEGDPMPTEAEYAEAARQERSRQEALRALLTGCRVPRA